MNIAPTTQLTSVTATSATGQVSSAPSSQPVTPLDTGGGTDRTQLSQMGELMSKLQNLETTNPAQAKQVLTNIASALSDKASSGGTTDQQLQGLADKFSQAAQTGDLSGLKPAQGGHHHHHHAAQSGGASSADATAAAAAASPKAASYLNSGSDRMAEIESVISSALNGATA